MSRAAFRLTDARGIPDLHKSPTGLVCVVRQPLIWAMLVALFITDVVWSARVGLSIGGWGITIGVVGEFVGAIGSLPSAQQQYRRHGRGGRSLGGIHRRWSSAHLSHRDVCTAAARCCGEQFRPRHRVRLAGLAQCGADAALAPRGSCNWRMPACCRRSSSRSPTSPKLGLAARNGELLLLAILTLLTTTLISALWPVLGPFAAFGEGHELAFLPDVLMLRAGGPWHFDLAAMEGIITMPSYHTGTGSIAHLRVSGYRLGRVGVSQGSMRLCCCRSRRVGGHYLADMIVGGAIAVLFMLGTRWLLSLEANR